MYNTLENYQLVLTMDLIKDPEGNFKIGSLFLGPKGSDVPVNALARKFTDDFSEEGLGRLLGITQMDGVNVYTTPLENETAIVDFLGSEIKRLAKKGEKGNPPDLTKEI